MQYQKMVLDNGLKLAGCEMKDKNSFAAGVWIDTGSRNENARVSGISHFLEHIVFKGSRGYSCKKLKESIEGVGGSFNAFTSEEMTCYWIKLPARYWELALDILSDMALYPLMKDADIEKERQVILEEIKMYKDLPQSYVHEMLDGLLWPGHPLGRSILGSNETMSRLNARDLRSYHRAQYTAANMVVSCAGRMDFGAVERKVSGIFGRMARKPANTCVPAGKPAKRPAFKLLHKETEQAHVALGFPALRRDHPLKYAQMLLQVILGGNSSSRLFNEIREKRGLAYEIGAEVKRLKDTGAFIVHAGVANKKLPQAVRLAFSELARIRDNPVPASELRRAKEFCTGQMMLSLEDSLTHMLWIGEPTLRGEKTYSLEDIVRRINAVSAGDIRTVARRIFMARSGCMAVIGPFKGRERELEGLLRC